jgi:hypothetical protein
MERIAVAVHGANTQPYNPPGPLPPPMRLGVLLSRNENEIAVRDLKDFVVKRFSLEGRDVKEEHSDRYREGSLVIVNRSDRDDWIRIRLLAHDDVKANLGGPGYVAVRVLLATPAGAKPGKVIMSDEGVFYVSLGSADGITVGQDWMHFAAWRNSRPLTRGRFWAGNGGGSPGWMRSRYTKSSARLGCMAILK